MLQAGVRSWGLLRLAPLRFTAPSTRAFGFGSHMADNDPEVLEKEKQKHLQGKTVSRMKHAPGWSEHLASDSEAVVKAEHCDDVSVEEMQQQTVSVLKEEEEADASVQHVEPKSGAMGGT